MRTDRNDTIAAIATAPGRAGVAVVRISGPDALEVGARVAGRPLRRPLQFVRTAHDACVTLVFRAPRSYTGEDVVEFQCHGGAVTPRRVLSDCFASGARPARRGEFTERAFLNGKLDCVQAESVLDLINAKTERAADAALEGLSGRSREEHRALYERALLLSTRLEHALDVSEEDLPPGFFPSVSADRARLKEKVDAAVRRAKEGKILRDGALVVLAGPPNAGKSSLLNALLGESRAIVSDVPGTTRDSIEAWVELDGFPVRLVDTAGLRQTDDAVEAEGVRRSEALIAKADVVVDLCGSGRIAAPGREVVAIHAKCDLSRGKGLNVSARTGEGLEALKREIVGRLCVRPRDADSEGGPSERARAVLLEAQARLATLESGAEASDLVLMANALRQVAEGLGTLVGATYASDIMESLFSRFCVGK